MKINKEGLDIIKKFEGFRPKAYLCPANVWTIGYGHTKDVRPNDTVTELQADALLRKDCATAEELVNKYIEMPLSNNQFSALVSLVFNCGHAPLKGTLGKLLNAGDYDGAADQFPRWNKAAGKVLNGLVVRREAERALFLKKAPVNWLSSLFKG